MAGERFATDNEMRGIRDSVSRTDTSASRALTQFLQRVGVQSHVRGDIRTGPSLVCERFARHGKSRLPVPSR
jgi:hypothetical protein